MARMRECRPDYLPLPGPLSSTQVIHMFNTAEDTTHREGAWRVLSEPAANFVRRRESHPAFKYERAWACNHCAAHYANGRADAQVTRTQAIKHARLVYVAEVELYRASG